MNNMFNDKEKFIIKELIEIEINDVKDMIENANKSDALELTSHLNVLNEILNKLKK